MEEALVSTGDIARKYGVSTATIRRWIKQSRIGYVEAGTARVRRRFRLSLEEFDKMFVKHFDAKEGDELEQVVYFVTVSDVPGVVKIGTTQDLQQRMNGIRGYHPTSRWTVLKTVPGGPDVEREFHKRFASSRWRGEWFKLTPDIREFISIKHST